MEKANQVRLNHELLIWRGFTLSNGVWSYPDGVTVDNGVPYFPEDETACFKWLVPKLGNLRLEYRHYNAGYMGYEAKILEVYDSDEYDTFFGIDKVPALSLCLAIQKLIRSK